MIAVDDEALPRAPYAVVRVAPKPEGRCHLRKTSAKRILVCICHTTASHIRRSKVKSFAMTYFHRRRNAFPGGYSFEVMRARMLYTTKHKKKAPTAKVSPFYKKTIGYGLPDFAEELNYGVDLSTI